MIVGGARVVSIALPKDLQEFVDHELGSGRYRSTDELLVAGLRLLQSEQREAVNAVKEGLAEMGRGEGTAIDEAFDELRQRHNIPPDA